MILPPLRPHFLSFYIILSLSGVLCTTTTRPRKSPSELLLPLHSTTALMCEPVFQGEEATATWFRDGRVVATVTSDSNAVYENRSYSSEQAMPEVGFLIISHVTKADEGEYWCRHDLTSEAGEVFYLRAAFVDQLPQEGHITLQPPNPSIAAPLALHCEPPAAVPRPSVVWTLDGLPVPESSSYPNGTLFIPYLSPSLHSGSFQCTVTNFAANTKSSIRIDTTKLSLHKDTGVSSVISKCSAVSGNIIVWFLIGCLATGCVVLLFLSLLLLLHPSRPSRPTLRPQMWMRSHPLLGPGFRKVVAPIPDLLVQPLNRSHEEII